MSTRLAVLGIGSYYIGYYVWHLAVLLLMLLAMRVFRRRLPGGLRLTTRALVGLLFLRLILFDNPVALRLYQRSLTPELIGARQWGVLDLDIDKYRRNLHQPRLANLAVGSSQVGAIFSNWVSDPPQELKVYSMAGMKTLDYVLNEDAIAAYNPERVILYLSAFDLTAAPELNSLQMAPSQPSGMWSVIERVRASGLKAADTDGPIHEYIASQLLPEYRYSFVFRAFLKRWFAAVPTPRTAALRLPALRPRFVPVAWFRADASSQAADDADRQHIEEFIGYYYPEWLDYNFAFLKDFVAFCAAHDIQVVIAEGQVSPKVRSQKVDALNVMVRSRFAELEAQFSNLMFIPASETYVFSVADYRDLTHVERAAAMVYTRRLSSLLAPPSIPEIKGSCGLTFLSGWYGRENVDTGWLRWSDGTGRIRVASRDRADLLLEGEVLSLARPNSIDVALDGQYATTIAVEDPGWAFHSFRPVAVHLEAGTSAVITFQGRAPAVRQTTDPRRLTIAVKDLVLQRTDGTPCELTADATMSWRPKSWQQ